MSNTNIFVRHITQRMAFLLPTLLFFFTTGTEPFAYRSLRWYHTLAISMLTFLLMKRTLSWRALGKYKWIYIFTALGWFLLLLTQYDFFLTAENVFKSIVALVTFLLLIPTLSHSKARKILFFGILYTAFMRGLIVLEYVQTDILISDSLTGFGKDKNFTGMILGMGILLLSSFILSRNVFFQYRLFSSGLAICFLYWIFHTASRSAAIAIFASILIIGIFYLFMAKGIGVKLRIIVFSIVIVIFSITIIQSVTTKYKLIQNNYTRLIELTRGERKDINKRFYRLDIGITQIKQNPFIGKGYGSSAYLVGEKRSLAHNSYLAKWIEFGLPGIISLLLFVIFVLMEITNQFNKMKFGNKPLFDLALSMSAIPLILMMATLDMSTIINFYVCLFASFEYERNCKKQSVRERF